MRRTSRYLVLTLLLGAGGCCKHGNVCGPLGTGVSQLATETETALRAKQSFYESSPAAPIADLADDCCNTWTSLVVIKHCSGQVDAYCKDPARCRNEEARSRCMTSERPRLIEQCLRTVYESFGRLVPACRPMSISKTNAHNTLWPYTQNQPPVRCPRTEDPSGH